MTLSFRHSTDQELLEALREHFKEAFSEIYDRYFTVLFKFAYKMAKDEALAKDAVQDFFTKFYKDKRILDASKPLGGYLYKSIQHKVLDLIKSKKNQIKALTKYSNECGYTIDNEFGEEELKDRIKKAIEHLPPQMKTIFEMSRIRHLSHKEIAEILDISEETVKRQISYAKEKLRNRPLFFSLLAGTISMLHRLFN